MSEEAKPSFWQIFKSFFRRKPVEPKVTTLNGVWWEQRHSIYRLGLTSDAIQQLGKVSFADLIVAPDDVLDQDEDILEVESDKVVQNFKTPFAGTVVDVNHFLVDNPDAINSNRQLENWILDIRIDFD